MESADKKDYWEQQAAKPLHKRGLGWWIEEASVWIGLGILVIVGTLLLLLT